VRNKHKFNNKVSCKCPYDSCGQTFDKVVTVEYVTNQRGDVIEHRVY
jgi:hypothetical protein